MSALIVLALWAHAAVQAVPCEGQPLEVPYGYEGAWAAEDEAWISNELQTWFAAHGREGCAPNPALAQERLVLVLRPDDTVAIELRRANKVIGERTLALSAVPLEGRTYAVAALAEELARSLWERPVRRVFFVGATGTAHIFYSGAKILGGGLCLGWSPVESLTFELGLTAAGTLAAQAPHGTTGGNALWLEASARYALLTFGPIVVGPRIGFEAGRLLLWGVDTGGLRRDGAATWALARGGLFLAIERDRWALRFAGSMGRTLSGAIVLDGADRVQVFDGAVAELALTVEVRF